MSSGFKYPGIFYLQPRDMPLKKKNEKKITVFKPQGSLMLSMTLYILNN
jgi:hypothetical protein